jgi:epoxyqueuosine reductase QueG
LYKEIKIMVNDEKGCCEGTGYEEEPLKNSEENENCCCGEESTANNPEKPEVTPDCGCGSGNDDVEEDAGCGCGCGATEYPDESLINNPDKPKVIADDNFIKAFEDVAHSKGIKSIGYTQLTPELLIKDKFIQYPSVIVLTMEMSKELIETAPGDKTQELNDAHYAKLGNLTYELSDYLRQNGYATEVAHPYGGVVKFSALGQKAGMGFIGQSGLLITPELGPRQKISAIFVSIANLPIKDENEHAWIPEYCEKCGKCIKACPEKALIEKETCCGGKEVEFIQKVCIGCSQGCTYCIEACPFDEKGYEHVKNKFDKMNAKLKEKQNKKFKPELWSNWAEQNSQMFAGLVNGATIAISMAQNEEKLILLEKADHDLNVSIKELEELERPVADLMFLIDEKDIKEILNDTASIKFMDMLSSGKIKVYGFISQTQLIDKGYMAFLNRLGLSLGGGGCCC